MTKLSFPTTSAYYIVGITFVFFGV